MTLTVIRMTWHRNVLAIVCSVDWNCAQVIFFLSAYIRKKVDIRPIITDHNAEL